MVFQESTTPYEIENLGQRSESITDTLENIESQLGLSHENEIISDDIRLAYLKISSLEGDIDNSLYSELQTEYNNILEGMNAVIQGSFESTREYLLATSTLMNQLSSLTVEGETTLSETNIDAPIWEMATAVYNGGEQAMEKIWEEIKGYLDLLDPDTYTQIIESLGQAWKSPGDMLQLIIDGIKDEASDVYRDIRLIQENSTSTGFLKEVITYLVSEGIALTISAIGPGKFLKILRVDKFLPENTVKISDNIKKDQDISSNVKNQIDGELPPAGTPLSLQQISEEATELGLKIEHFSELYRLDKRSPSEIIKSGGFKPNPNKEPMGIKDHIAPGSPGGSNLVSTSYESAHSGTLLDPMFFDKTRMTGEIPTKKFNTPQDIPPLEFKRYEYKIKGQDGVKIESGGLDTEKEVIIPGANIDQIEVREITIQQRFTEEIIDLSEPGDPYLLYTYQPQKLSDIPSEQISTGDWKTLE